MKRMIFALSLLVTGVFACAMPASAQTYQVANSTGGAQVAAAPINAIVSNLNSNISYAQSTANNATSTANYAVAVGSNAQATANWAGDVASNANNTANSAWNTANAIAGRVDATWNLAIADCRLAMSGDPFNTCGLNNPRPW